MKRDVEDLLVVMHALRGLVHRYSTRHSVSMYDRDVASELLLFVTPPLVS